jgi:fatty acyl-CoA reductase
MLGRQLRDVCRNCKAMTETSAFFKGKTVLLTGGSGFLGKVLLEKILWQLPEIGKIVLPIRPHSNKDPEAAVRLRAQREIFSSSVFSRLRSRHGQSFEAFVHAKVQVLPGDVTSPDLGLPSHLIDTFDSELDLIINLAALVGFDERLDHAVEANTLGSYHLLNFAKRFRNPTMLHVSTAFVNGRCSGPIPEDVQEPDVTPFDRMGIRCDEHFSVEREIERVRRLAKAVESESRTPSARSEFQHAARVRLLSDRGLNAVEIDNAAEKQRQRWVSNILSQDGLSRARQYGWFDTYTFTKAMGEQLLVKSTNGIPIIILRPSIIESSLRQPEPGWIDCFQTSTPILFGYGKGEVPDFPGKRNSLIDFIPVDFVANAILATLTAASSTSHKVFHVASSSENPLRLEDLMNYCLHYFRDFPLRGRFNNSTLQPWKYRTRQNFNWWLGWRRQVLRTAITLNDYLNFWPGAARLSHKLAFEQMQVERLEYYTRLYADYTRLSCQFTTDNTRRLFQSLAHQDQHEFFFDPTAIEWQTYIQQIHLPGVRRNVLKRLGPRSVKSMAA